MTNSDLDEIERRLIEFRRKYGNVNLFHEYPPLFVDQVLAIVERRKNITAAEDGSNKMIDIEQLGALEKAMSPAPWRELALAYIVSNLENPPKADGPDQEGLLAFRNAMPVALALLEEARKLCERLVERNGVFGTRSLEQTRAFLAKLNTKREGCMTQEKSKP